MRTELRPQCHCGGYKKVVTRSIDVQTIESSFEPPFAREPAILDEFLVPAEEEQTEKMVTEYEILNIVEPSHDEPQAEWSTAEVPAAQYEGGEKEEILPGKIISITIIT